jgi:hypothetical protein
MPAVIRTADLLVSAAGGLYPAELRAHSRAANSNEVQRENRITAAKPPKPSRQPPTGQLLSRGTLWALARPQEMQEEREMTPHIAGDQKMFADVLVPVFP